MTFLIYATVAVAALLVLYAVWAEAHTRRKYGIGIVEYNRLSWPAQQVLASFYELPKDNRPAVDMVSVLKALDTKYGGRKAVTSEYMERDWNGGVFYSWSAACGSVRTDYAGLYNSAKAVQTALAEQKHQFIMRGIEDRLDHAKTLVEQMNDEAKTIRTITKEVIGELP